MCAGGEWDGTILKADDAVLRRQANRAGVYGRPVPVVFAGILLKAGEDVLTLQGGGMMYDTVVLEAA